eukprot:166401-Chlamydomonas_euryale.AAC.1
MRTCSRCRGLVHRLGQERRREWQAGAGAIAGICASLHHPRPRLLHAVWEVHREAHGLAAGADQRQGRGGGAASGGGARC